MHQTQSDSTSGRMRRDNEPGKSEGQQSKTDLLEVKLITVVKLEIFLKVFLLCRNKEGRDLCAKRKVAKKYGWCHVKQPDPVKIKFSNNHFDKIFLNFGCIFCRNLMRIGECVPDIAAGILTSWNTELLWKLGSTSWATKAAAVWEHLPTSKQTSR